MQDLCAVSICTLTKPQSLNYPPPVDQEWFLTCPIRYVYKISISCASFNEFSQYRRTDMTVPLAFDGAKKWVPKSRSCVFFLVVQRSFVRLLPYQLEKWRTEFHCAYNQSQCCWLSLLTNVLKDIRNPGFVTGTRELWLSRNFFQDGLYIPTANRNTSGYNAFYFY